MNFTTKTKLANEVSIFSNLWIFIFLTNTLFLVEIEEGQFKTSFSQVHNSKFYLESENNEHEVLVYTNVTCNYLRLHAIINQVKRLILAVSYMQIAEGLSTIANKVNQNTSRAIKASPISHWILFNLPTLIYFLKIENV